MAQAGLAHPQVADPPVVSVLLGEAAADLTALAVVGDSAPRELLQAVNVDRAPAAATAEGTTGSDGFLKFFPLGPVPFQRGSGPFFGLPSKVYIISVIGTYLNLTDPTSSLYTFSTPLNSSDGAMKAR
jgi:hypothetical protein